MLDVQVEVLTGVSCAWISKRIINQFGYIKIHSKTIDLSTRLRGITTAYSPEPRAEVYIYFFTYTDIKIGVL